MKQVMVHVYKFSELQSYAKENAFENYKAYPRNVRGEIEPKKCGDPVTIDEYADLSEGYSWYYFGDGKFYGCFLSPPLPCGTPSVNPIGLGEK